MGRYLLLGAAFCAAFGDISDTKLSNPFPNIPPQCYTKTEGKYNPCYSCHTKGKAPNYIDDSALQESYAFPQEALENHWSNLFVDRSKAVREISDAFISDYVTKDNYTPLAPKLRALPKEWDVNGDGKWGGYIPDCNFAFDSQGFDRDADGGYSGWRAFRYRPFLGTFFPTNGSSDDVLIRLPSPFMQDSQGRFDIEIYKQNLELLSELIQGIKRAKLWNPREGKQLYYYGKAGVLQKEGNLHLAQGLYPEGTEFLHTVRYLDTAAGEVRLSKRIKEVRYAKKGYWVDYATLRNNAYAAIKEKAIDPDNPEVYLGDAERGIQNRSGWVYQGYIEDANGDLRPQSYEEHIFCMGCHSNLGATTDNTFAFPRIVEKERWLHFSQKGLQNITDMETPTGSEYVTYLQKCGAGDEFRENREIIERFFDKNGSLDLRKAASVKKDISTLLLPSLQRAVELNKGYYLIVKEQSFLKGRDGTTRVFNNVHRLLKEEEGTGLERFYY